MKVYFQVMFGAAAVYFLMVNTVGGGSNPDSDSEIKRKKNNEKR